MTDDNRDKDRQQGVAGAKQPAGTPHPHGKRSLPGRRRLVTIIILLAVALMLLCSISWNVEDTFDAAFVLEPEEGLVIQRIGWDRFPEELAAKNDIAAILKAVHPEVIETNPFTVPVTYQERRMLLGFRWGYRQVDRAILLVAETSAGRMLKGVPLPKRGDPMPIRVHLAPGRQPKTAPASRPTSMPGLFQGWQP